MNHADDEAPNLSDEHQTSETNIRPIRTPRRDEKTPLLTLSILFEGGIGGLAILLAAILSFPLWERFPSEPSAWTEGFFLGILCSLPPLLFLAATGRARWRPLRRVSWIIDRFLVPMFRGRGLITLFVVSLMAGVGEELFFRGFIQQYVADLLGGTIGLLLGVAAGAALFGLMHPMTVGYVVYAALMGVYLGVALITTDNLLVPIVAHAFYDFVALIYYVRIRQRKRRTGVSTIGNL